MDTARKIKVERMKQGLAQADLIKKCNGQLSITGLSNIERGANKGTFETICIIADALGINVDSLRPDKE